MKITRRQLNEISHRELNEGFFDSLSNFFKSSETTKREEKAPQHSLAYRRGAGPNS